MTAPLRKVRILGTEEHRRVPRRVPGGWAGSCSCGGWAADQPSGASRAAAAWLAHTEARAAELGVQAEPPPARPQVDVARFTVTCGRCGLSMDRGPYPGVPSVGVAVLIATRRGCPRCGGTLAPAAEAP